MPARNTRKQVLVIRDGVAGLAVASTLGRKWRSSGEECLSQSVMTLIESCPRLLAAFSEDVSVATKYFHTIQLNYNRLFKFIK